MTPAIGRSLVKAWAHKQESGSRLACIYSLRHPERKMIRYVGKTLDRKKRAYNHLTGRGNPSMQKWIKEMKARGKAPFMEILEVCNEDNWHVREAFYIRKFRREGHKLYNRYDGVRHRTDDGTRKSIQEIVVKATYYRSSNSSSLYVGLSKNTYWLLEGNIVSQQRGYDRYGDCPNSQYFFITFEGKSYLLPRKCSIYRLRRGEIPVLPKNFRRASSFF